jgi:hypothetical protein
MRRRLLVGPGALVATLVAASILVPTLVASGDQARVEQTLERAPLVAPVADTAPPTTAAPAPPPTEPPTTTTTTTAPPPPPTTTVPPQRFTMTPYTGLGAWLDVYDWTTIYAQHAPAVEPDVLDVLAAQGVQTLFIQASKWDAPEYVIEPARLLAFIDRAHQHGISVVGWYLPTLEDVGLDLQRLLAIAAYPVDGVAVDIESRKVGDIAERNHRLIVLSQELRKNLPGEVIGAIPLEPVLMEDVNPRFWPSFPWAEIGPLYDVWLPMAYWTNRRPDTPWRDAHTYTVTNIDRIRAHIGRPDAPVHVLGGIGDQTTVGDLHGFRRAAGDRGAIGGSIYDFRTTFAEHWPELLPFRDTRR